MSSPKTNANNPVYAEIIAILDRKIEECERRADNSLARRKYIMFGYHKAIAVHLRKVKRKFIKVHRATAQKAEKSPKSHYPDPDNPK